MLFWEEDFVYHFHRSLAVLSAMIPILVKLEDLLNYNALLLGLDTNVPLKASERCPASIIIGRIL